VDERTSFHGKPVTWLRLALLRLGGKVPAVRTKASLIVGVLGPWLWFAAPALGQSVAQTVPADTALGASVNANVAAAAASQPNEASVPASSVNKPNDPMLEPMPPAAKILSGWPEAVELLKARSVDLKSAVLDVAAAEGQSRVALASALPSLTASSVYTHQFLTRQINQTTRDPATGLPISTTTNTTPMPNTLSGSLQLKQPLFNLRAWYSIGTAELGEEIARLTVEDLKRRLTLNAANTVMALVTAERIAELNRVALYSSLERLELAKAKFRNGASTGLDVERAEQDVVSVRSAVVSGDESVRQAREALGLALGFSEPIGLLPDLVLDNLLNNVVDSCKRENDWRARPDVVAAERRQALARRKVTDVKLQFAPTVDLQSSLSTSTPVTGVSPATLWNIQGVLTWPIWEGGARYGLMKSARAAAEQSDLQRELLGRQVAVNVVQVQRAIQVAELTAQVAEQSRNHAAKIDEMTQKTFRAGLATSLELVTAASALRQAEINLALQQFNLVNSRITLALTVAKCLN